MYMEFIICHWSHCLLGITWPMLYIVVGNVRMYCKKKKNYCRIYMKIKILRNLFMRLRIPVLHRVFLSWLNVSSELDMK